MAEYLRTELLSRLSDAEVTFLTRTAVLDRMSGPLCDAVLDSTGSGAVLESLAHSNLLLVALDRHGEWYRYHHLFRDLLRAELQRREPELVPRAACPRRRVVRGEPHARAGDRPRAGGRRRRTGQSAHAAERAEGIRHGTRARPSGVGWRGSRTRTWSSSIPRSRCSVRSSTPPPARRPRPSAGPMPRNTRRRRCSPMEAPARIADRPSGSFPTAARWRAGAPSFAAYSVATASTRCDVTRRAALDGLSAASGYRCAALVLHGLCLPPRR